MVSVAICRAYFLAELKNSEFCYKFIPKRNKILSIAKNQKRINPCNLWEIKEIIFVIICVIRGQKFMVNL